MENTENLTLSQKITSLRAAAMGNALEWFDWTLYGIFSVYLALNLFEKTDPKSAMLSTLAIFAGGFIARPLGGWLFGYLGDHMGRKNTMVITMVLLALSSVGIGLIPTYDSIGYWASALLLFFRLIQGLAHGGESGVSYTYIAEIAPAKNRGLWSSSVFVSVTVGVMAATALAAMLTAALGNEAMQDYGWRIGFYIGGVLGIYALVLRRKASETEAFTKLSHDKAPPKKITKREIALISLKIIMLSCASNVAYYTWVTFAPSTAIANGMDASGAYQVSLFAQILCLFWLPTCGWLSDKYGRKPIVIAWGLAVIAFTIPIATMVTTQPYTLFIAQVLGLGSWALIASIYPAVVAEQVPTHARAQGVGFITSLSVAIFGGTAPYLRAWLATVEMEYVYNYYVMVLGLLAIIAGIIIKETARVNLDKI